MLSRTPALGTAVAGDQQDGAASARLHGRTLVLARGAWLAVTVVAVAVFMASLPVTWAQLHTACAPSQYGNGPQLSALQMDGLRHLGLTLDSYAAFFIALFSVFCAVHIAVATLIVARLPAEPMAVVGALVLVLFGAVAFPAAPMTLVAAAPAWRLPRAGLYALGQACSIVFLYVFPDGRFVPRWSCLPALAWTVICLQLAIVPATPDTPDRLPPLLGIILEVAIFGPIPVVQIYRYRRLASAVQRQQTKWVVFGLVLAFILLVGGNALDPSLRPALGTNVVLFAVVQALAWLSVLPIPLSIGVAILRYRLWDVDLLIHRTLVYGALTAAIVALYALVVGAVGALLQARGSFVVSLVATGLVAVLFQPLRAQLQQAVNRLLHGARDEPYAVLAGLGQRLEATLTLAPEAVLPTVVEMVAQALKLPYAAITLRDGYEGNTGNGVAPAPLPVAAYGAPVPAPLALPLVYQQETVGHLLLAPRAGTGGFSPADRRLFDDLARQAGIAAHAVRLTADLQRARERLVLAREEERRRLRRDLHDGLGPTLAMLTLHVDGARQVLRRDVEAADRLLVDLKTQMQGTVKDIRQIVYALRPPALDDLGLLGALRELARPYHADGLPGDAGPCITVETPDVLPPLPAAVEVATYRIAQEAVTNVVRHAQARRCHVRVAIDEALTLVVVDDGMGLPAAPRAGVGLGSTRECAEEVGGACTIEVFPTGGTRVLARLPLRATAQTRRPYRLAQADREEQHPWHP